MLVLSRKVGEIITIGTVKVTVVEIRGSHVRLGIEAPAEIPISRPDAKRKERSPAPVLRSPRRYPTNRRA